MNTVRMILCGNVEDSRMNKIKILKNFIWNTLLH